MKMLLDNFIMRKSSLPSLHVRSNSEPSGKLFATSTQVASAKSYFSTLFSAPEQKDMKPPRTLIQFVEPVTQGFTSFKTINKTHEQDMLSSLKQLPTNSAIKQSPRTHTRSQSLLETKQQEVPAVSSLKKELKAEIILNALHYSKYQDYTSRKSRQGIQEFLASLKKMEPLPSPCKTNIKQYVPSRTQSLSFHLDYSAYENSRICWKPFIDYDAMCVHFEGKVYFIGGRNIDKIGCYDVISTKFSQINPIAGIKPFGESEGTLTVSEEGEKEIIFYGGVAFFSVGMSQCTNSLIRLNLNQMTCKYEYYPKIQPRTFHAQCKFGDYLFLSGGIGSTNNLLNSFATYHLHKKYWSELVIKNIPQGLKHGFAKHKMMTLMHRRKRYLIYQDEPILATQEQRLNLAIEGIYIFGGEYVKKQRDTEQQEMSNKLYILRLGKGNLEIMEPAVKGQAPLARKAFGWCHTKHYLIIQGGRNDELNPFVLNNISVLQLRYMEWIGVSGELPTCRHSHIMIGNSSQIVILGGKNNQGLCKEVLSMTYTENT